MIRVVFLHVALPGYSQNGDKTQDKHYPAKIICDGGFQLHETSSVKSFSTPSLPFFSGMGQSPYYVKEQRKTRGNAQLK
jgi:hypothetical protein